MTNQSARDVIANLLALIDDAERAIEALRTHGFLYRQQRDVIIETLGEQVYEMRAELSRLNPKEGKHDEQK